MIGQESLKALLGAARLAPYLDAAGGSTTRALELYLWAVELSGAFHAQASFVEVAVRNAMDSKLSSWNVAQGPEYGADWTAEGSAAPLLYDLLGKQLRTARKWALDDAGLRGQNHPRHGASITHDDVIAQLMFGTWVRLVRPMSASESGANQQQLWNEVLHQAFPYGENSDQSRKSIGNQLEAVRKLRNRVAHHDNLLNVKVSHRFNGMLSLLAKIDPQYPQLTTARSQLRRLAREDPRRNW